MESHYAVVCLKRSFYDRLGSFIFFIRFSMSDFHVFSDTEAQMLGARKSRNRWKKIVEENSVCQLVSSQLSIRDIIPPVWLSIRTRLSATISKKVNSVVSLRFAFYSLNFVLENKQNKQKSFYGRTRAEVFLIDVTINQSFARAEYDFRSSFASFQRPSSVLIYYLLLSFPPLGPRVRIWVRF